MAQRPKRRCSSSFCPTLIPAGERFCKVHTKTHHQAIDQRRGSASKRGYGARWQRLRKLILARDPICRTCHNALSTDVDHVIAKANGGQDTEENLAGRCHACHSRLTVQYDGGFGRSKGQKEIS